MLNNSTNGRSTNFGFDAMPQAMLEDMMGATRNLAKNFSARFRDLDPISQRVRDALQSRNWIESDATFTDSPILTCCGVDGSHKKEVMLSGDIVAVCAVAVEGIAPPKEEKKWEAPRHSMFLEGEQHNSDLERLIHCLMFVYEMRLASEAPHGLVLMDFGIVSPLFVLITVMERLDNFSDLKIVRELKELYEEFISNYTSALESGVNGSGKIFVGVPKSGTSKDVLDRVLELPKAELNMLGNERAAMSLILKEGEFTKPLQIRSNFEPSPYLGKGTASALEKFLGTRVAYYKPSSLLPAFRLEVPHAAAMDKRQFGAVIRTVKHQTPTPGILEPWPLYLADRMARSMNASVPFVSSAISRFAFDNHEGDLDNLFTMLMHHRTQRGIG